LVQPVTFKQKVAAFIRWRNRNGFPVAKYKRVFWGKKSWRRKQKAAE
jgi:hypothetical protein